MPKQSEHLMLKQCSSIHARIFPEQCSTDNTYGLTWIFGLLEQISHVRNVRRGAARFAPFENLKSARSHLEAAHGA